MKETIKIIGVIFGSIIGFLLIIYFAIWLFTPKNAKVEVPNPNAYRGECLKEKSDLIYQRYEQCVKDSQGNNIRCRDMAREIACPYIWE